MRVIAFAASFMLAAFSCSASSIAAGLANFTFQGTADTVLVVVDGAVVGPVPATSPVVGRFTLDLNTPVSSNSFDYFDAGIPLSPPSSSVSARSATYAGSVTRATVELELNAASLIGLRQNNGLRNYVAVEDGRVLDERDIIFPERDDLFALGLSLTGPLSPILSTFDMELGQVDIFSALTDLTLTSVVGGGLIDTTDLSIETLTAFLNAGVRFEVFGSVFATASNFPGEVATGFFALSGDVTSFSAPEPIPLPAAAWLLLSALAALAGIKIWPGLRRS